MDTALKQRLVGASVLIALAVIVLPMLLGGRPGDQNQESQKIELPPQPPELDFETRRYPIGEQPPAPQPDDSQVTIKPLPSPGTPGDPAPRPLEEPTVEAAPGSEAVTTQSEVATPPALTPLPQQERQPEVLAPDESPAAVSSQVEPVAQQGGRYIVQVASFGAVNNANRLAEQLKGFGYSVMLDTVKSDVGTLHRVRIGPYSGESEATGVATRLRTQISGLKPRVMDLQPEKASQVTKPSDPLVRWVVQVGSFSSATNADNLVARLRLESFTAYKEAVSGSGSTIYRVRVGPFLEREEAIKADSMVNDRLSIDGVVMSAN